MSFAKVFQQKVRAVWLRCSVNLFLRNAGWVLVIAGAIAALAVLTEKLLAVPVLVPWRLWAFWTVAAALTVVPWLLRLPNRMQASLLLDERLRLHERFSTTLALADSEDPFAKAARAESLKAVQGANVRGHFPIGLSRHWYYGAAVWLVAIALVLFLPQQDLLGFLRRQEEQQQKQQELEQARTEVKETTEAVSAAVKQLGDAELEQELETLDELAQAGEPEEAKRQAIKAMGDLSEKIKRMQSGAQMEAANMLEQKLRRLRGSVDPFAQQIRMALAKGDFAQAANILTQLQKQLGDGKLSDQQRRQLAKQLQELAKELQNLAEQKRELEKELEKLGLDKKLTKLTRQQLKQALEQQGLKPDMVEQLLKKMAACQGACSLCAGLAGAMSAGGGGVGGLSADDLADAIEQLSALESLQQQAMLMQVSLDEIARCMGCLGEGLCQGACQGPFREGWYQQFTQGTGGPGMGTGPRATDTEGQTGSKTTRVTSESQEGPVVASWYFKDIQIKGESRRDFAEVVEAGRASAAEAISENQIPRKYEDAVKGYFGQLAERGQQP